MSLIFQELQELESAIGNFHPSLNPHEDEFLRCIAFKESSKAKDVRPELNDEFFCPSVDGQHLPSPVVSQWVASGWNNISLPKCPSNSSKSAFLDSADEKLSERFSEPEHIELEQPFVARSLPRIQESRTAINEGTTALSAGHGAALDSVTEQEVEVMRTEGSPKAARDSNLRCAFRKHGRAQVPDSRGNSVDFVSAVAIGLVAVSLAVGLAQSRSSARTVR